MASIRITRMNSGNDFRTRLLYPDWPIWRGNMAASCTLAYRSQRRSEAGRVSGKITRVHVRDVEYKGHTRHATQEEPQYEIKSDRTDHVAMHKGSALSKLS